MTMGSYKNGTTRVDIRITERLRDFYPIGAAAELLALRAIPVAVRNDGIVPTAALGAIGRGIYGLQRRVDELVSAGVWIQSEHGWWMDVGRSTHCRAKGDDRWKLTPGLRTRILERDGNRCQACGSSETLVVDHVLAVANGGKTEFDNLQALCAPCNGSKGTRSWEDFLESLVR